MIDSAHLDKVAEAIWSQHGIFGPAAWDTTDATRDRYRRMAQAAIDALQLTEERRRELPGFGELSRKQARLVGPWVRVDGGDA